LEKGIDFGNPETLSTVWRRKQIYQSATLKMVQSNEGV
jgi:hypothetical protein